MAHNIRMRFISIWDSSLQLKHPIEYKQSSSTTTTTPPPPPPDYQPKPETSTPFYIYIHLYTCTSTHTLPQPSPMSSSTTHAAATTDEKIDTNSLELLTQPDAMCASDELAPLVATLTSSIGSLISTLKQIYAPPPAPQIVKHTTKIDSATCVPLKLDMDVPDDETKQDIGVPTPTPEPEREPATESDKPTVKATVKPVNLSCRTSDGTEKGSGKWKTTRRGQETDMVDAPPPSRRTTSPKKRSRKERSTVPGSSGGTDTSSSSSEKRKRKRQRQRARAPSVADTAPADTPAPVAKASSSSSDPNRKKRRRRKRALEAENERAQKLSVSGAS